jgi:hypothetical protein
MKTWQNYPVKKDSNNNYYIAHLLKGHYVSDYHVIPNDPMGAYDYDEIAAFYKRLTGAEMVYNAEGDLVVQKQVVPEHAIDELKARKLTEVDNWTADKITGGFISECTGKPVRYDSDKDTQLTMQGIALNVSTERFANEYPLGCPVRGYKEGETEKTIQYLNATQVYTWCADLSSHIGACKQQGWIKQAQVEAALSKEDLDAIILD